MDQLPFRVQRIFNGLFSPQDNYQQEDNTQQPLNSTPINNASLQPSPDMIIKGLMTGQNTAGDRLNQMLQEQPMHDDFKPSFGRKLAGGLMNITDPNMAKAFVDRPYNNAMQDWSGKLKPLGELADSERASNTNNRLIGSGLLKDQQAQERVDATKRGQDIAAETADKNRAQKESFKAYLENKAMNPGDKLSEDSDGLVFSFNPVTKAVTYLKGEDGGPIHSSKLPELAKAELTHKNKLEEIDATTAGRNSSIITKGNTDVLTSSRTLPDKINLKTATPGKNTSAVQSAVKPGDEQIKVIHPGDKTHPAGTPGFVKKSQLRDALAQGFVVVPDTPQKTTGVGLNLKPVVPKVGF